MPRDPFQPLMSALLDLPPEHLFRVVRGFEAVGHYLAEQSRIRRAENEREGEPTGPEIIARFQKSIPRRVAELVTAGMSEEQAKARLAAEGPLSLDGINLYLKRHRKAEAEAQRQKRDLQIMRMAGRGYGNAQIAKRVGLSSGQISRIIQANLKRNRVKVRIGRGASPSRIGAADDRQ